VALKARGLILEVVSNFDSRLSPILEGLGLGPLLDSIILSSRAGSAKPAPAIFHQALRRHDLKANEALHVGDSHEKDVLGARAAGLAAVLVDRREKGAGDSVTRVRDLTELLPLIGGKVQGLKV